MVSEFFVEKIREKGWWGQAPLNFYKIINLDIRTIEIVYEVC